MSTAFSELIEKSAARLRTLAQENRNKSKLAGAAYEQAGSNSTVGAILFDLAVEKVAGPLSDAEMAVAEKVAYQTGFEWKMFLSLRGQKLVRDELAAEARRLAAIPKMQLTLEAA